ALTRKSVLLYCIKSLPSNEISLLTATSSSPGVFTAGACCSVVVSVVSVDSSLVWLPPQAAARTAPATTGIKKNCFIFCLNLVCAPKVTEFRKEQKCIYH